MLTKKELEDKIAKWDGVNDYIVKNAKRDLREGNYADAEAPVEEPKAEAPKKWTAKELKALSKDEQSKMLARFGEGIPRYEKDRVKLLLKLLN